jgi:hypothetical protein
MFTKKICQLWIAVLRKEKYVNFKLLCFLKQITEWGTRLNVIAIGRATVGADNSGVLLSCTLPPNTRARQAFVFKEFQIHGAIQLTVQ